MSKELMIEHNELKNYNTSTIYTINSDGIYLDGYGGILSNYVPINPSGKTYYFDIILSIDTGNQFYIGWERYDAAKTSRSNNACVYAIYAKPTSDIKYARYKGTINLATDTVNPTAFIRLRILNKWSGSTSGTTGKAIIHQISLREISTGDNFETANVSKTGQLRTDYFRETNIQQTKFSKNGFVDANNFYEY